MISGDQVRSPSTIATIATDQSPQQGRQQIEILVSHQVTVEYSDGETAEWGSVSPTREAVVWVGERGGVR